jgi:phage gp36-like protein
MTTYCQPNDLLVGDISGVEPLKQQFITAATEEIDSQLGFIYELPLSGASAHGTLILKGICRKLASGRLLMAQASASEDNSVHAYGMSLVEEAQRDLWSIRNAQTDIGAVKVASAATSGNAPTIIQGDTTSGVDYFYAWLNRSRFDTQRPDPWAPGVTT